MPRGNYRRPYQAPFDASITQEIETALRDAGRDDVIELVRKSGMRELETNLHAAEERIKALEVERVNWLTESGMFRAIDERAAKAAVSLWKKLAAAAAGAAAKAVAVAVATGILGLIGLVAKLIWTWKGTR